MESGEEINLNIESGGGNNGKSGDGFIDRSKVRILLCDNDSNSSQEVFTLLLGCSYQGMYGYSTQLNPFFYPLCFFLLPFFYLFAFCVLSLLAVVMFMPSFKFRRKKCCVWPCLVNSINLNMLLEKGYFGIGFCW